MKLEPLFRRAARGRSAEDGQSEYSKLTPDRALDLLFDVPCHDDGSLDHAVQVQLVEDAARVELFQERTRALQRLISSVVLLPEIGGTETVTLSLTDPSTFELVTRMTGWFKRHWAPLDTGDPSDIPVYSAAPRPHAHVRAAAAEKKVIYASVDQKFVSFAVDGDGSAGTNLVVHDRPFLISNNRTALKILRDDVLAEYVALALRTMKSDYGFSFNYKAYRDHLEEVVLTVPATKTGTPDLAAQHNAVKEVTKLEGLQAQTVELLRGLLEVQVDVER